MNLMLNRLTKFQPVFAPADEGGTPPPDPDVGDPPPDPAPEPIELDYSFLPDDFNGDDGPNVEGFRARYDELTAAEAIRAEASENVPEDASGYEFAIPEDIDFGEFELPENFKVELQTDDPTMAPLFEELGGVLHGLDAPKDAAGKVMTVLAKYRATEYAQAVSEAQAEMATLGSAVDSRIANIDRALATRLPAELAAGLKSATTTAAGIKALEKLLAPRTLKTPTPVPNGGAFSEEMTPSERLREANRQAAKQ